MQLLFVCYLDDVVVVLHGLGVHGLPEHHLRVYLRQLLDERLALLHAAKRTQILVRPDGVRAVADRLILAWIDAVTLGVDPSTTVVALDHALLIVEPLDRHSRALCRIHIGLRVFLIQLQADRAVELGVVARHAIKAQILRRLTSGRSLGQVVELHAASTKGQKLSCLFSPPCVDCGNGSDLPRILGRCVALVAHHASGAHPLIQLVWQRRRLDTMLVMRTFAPRARDVEFAAHRESALQATALCHAAPGE